MKKIIFYYFEKHYDDETLETKNDLKKPRYKKNMKNNNDNCVCCV